MLSIGAVEIRQCDSRRLFAMLTIGDSRVDKVSIGDPHIAYNVRACPCYVFLFL